MYNRKPKSRAGKLENYTKLSRGFCCLQQARKSGDFFANLGKHFFEMHQTLAAAFTTLTLRKSHRKVFKTNEFITRLDRQMNNLFKI